MTTAFGRPVAGDDALAMRRVTTIGECMVELAPEQQAGLFQQGFAGDTFNTLWYLKSLRPDWTAAISRVSGMMRFRPRCWK